MSDHIESVISQPWPHVDSASDVLDCTDHLNKAAKLAVLA